MDHSSFTYLVSPDGQEVTIFPPGTPPESMAGDDRGADGAGRPAPERPPPRSRCRPRAGQGPARGRKEGLPRPGRAGPSLAGNRTRGEEHHEQRTVGAVRFSGHRRRASPERPRRPGWPRPAGRSSCWNARRSPATTPPVGRRPCSTETYGPPAIPSADEPQPRLPDRTAGRVLRTIRCSVPAGRCWSAGRTRRRRSRPPLPRGADRVDGLVRLDGSRCPGAVAGAARGLRRRGGARARRHGHGRGRAAPGLSQGSCAGAGGLVLTDAEVSVVDRSGGGLAGAPLRRAHRGCRGAGRPRPAPGRRRVAALAGAAPIGLVPKPPDHPSRSIRVAAGVPITADAIAGLADAGRRGRGLLHEAGERPAHGLAGRRKHRRRPATPSPTNTTSRIAGAHRVEQATTLEIRRIAHSWAGAAQLRHRQDARGGVRRRRSGGAVLLAGGPGEAMASRPPRRWAGWAAALALEREVPQDVRALGVTAADLAPGPAGTQGAVLEVEARRRLIEFRCRLGTPRRRSGRTTENPPPRPAARPWPCRRCGPCRPASAGLPPLPMPPAAGAAPPFWRSPLSRTVAACSGPPRVFDRSTPRLADALVGMSRSDAPSPAPADRGQHAAARSASKPPGLRRKGQVREDSPYVYSDSTRGGGHPPAGSPVIRRSRRGCATPIAKWCSRSPTGGVVDARYRSATGQPDGDPRGRLPRDDIVESCLARPRPRPPPIRWKAPNDVGNGPAAKGEGILRPKGRR